MIVPRYLPGGWVAVVTEGCIALLPETTPVSVIDEVWDVLRARDGMEALLPILTDRRALGAFGLVEVAGPSVRACLRGPVELEAVGGRALGSATSDQGTSLRAVGVSDVPWIGVDWADVDELTLRALDQTAPGAVAGRGTGWPILAGVVPAACVTVHMRVSVSLPASSIGGAAAAGANDLEVELYGDTILSLPAGVRDEFIDMTTPRPTVAMAAPAAPAAPAVPAEPAAPEHSGPLAAGSRTRAIEDHDGQTIMSSDLVEIRRSLPSWSHPQVPGPFAVPTEIAPAKLLMSSGLVVTLDRAVLIGRAPVVTRVANRDLPRLVTVASPHHDISRTHAQVVQEGQRVFITDLNSTNGVVLHARGAAPARVRPGVATEIGPDATVDIGDGVTFRVVRS